MIKTNLLYKYPKEYLEIFNKLKGGSTIDSFVDLIESSIKTIFKTSNEFNAKKLQIDLGNNFTVNYNDGDISVIDDIDSDYHITDIKKILPEVARLNKNTKTWEVNNKKLNYYVNSEDIDKFRGNSLEIFAEIFFNIFSADPTLGIKNYTPIPIGEDFGADAVGENVNGDQCVIQVKYRKDDCSFITYEEMTKPYYQGVHRFKYDMNKPHTLVLFTTSNKATAALEQEMINKKQVIAIFRKHIATKVDRNVNFWKTAYEMVEEKLQ